MRPLLFAAVVSTVAALTCTASAQDVPLLRTPVLEPVTVTATPDDFVEGTLSKITLTSVVRIDAGGYLWKQASGPRVRLFDLGLNKAVAWVNPLEVAVDTELVFQLHLFPWVNPTEEWIYQADEGFVWGEATVRVRPADIEPVLGPYTQIGGASTAVATFQHAGADWTLFNVGSRLSATRVGSPASDVYSITVQGFVQDILVVEYGGARHLLLATGTEGIAFVDATDPTQMVWRGNVGANYYKDDLTFTEGGGAILTGQVISGTRGNVTALETDGTTLWIANADYGLHRTALANVLGGPGPMVEADGTLFIEHEEYTLLYAGEVPWGGPQSLGVVDGKLFVALEFLGLGIYDGLSLQNVGRYNMYCDVGVHEDWFLDMDVALEVQPGFLDAVTGMPDYRQASFEIESSHGAGSGGGDFKTPWADFDKYGKYYYNSRTVDVVQYPSKTLAYIAYGLGGLVAVDVSGFEAATAAAPVVPTYLGYAPGVPAHGSDEFIGEHFKSIFPRFGSGMLKEAGVVDVSVSGGKAYYTDHFAGLVILAGADDPAANWHGDAAPYDNDNGIPGDHEPDYEFVTSYDMSPYDPEDHESLPTWMYESPSELVTGEIGGHGNAMVLMPTLQLASAGNIDVLVCLGAGGFGFVDIVDLTAPLQKNRFLLPEYFPPTDEIGAAPDGSPTQTIAIGHSQGITASERYLYLADGPHGVSAWKLVNDYGRPTDAVHLVANTVQDEYPVTVGTTTVYPATHAFGVVYDPVKQAVLTMCQSIGMRRLDVSGVEKGKGAIGSPLLISPQPTDIFEHNGAYGKISSVPKQDHAYDVAIDGDLAYVADGGNGLTIYDLTKDPTDMDSGFFVGNLGGATKQRPLLGRSTGIALWDDPVGGEKYAMVAAGPYGIGVAIVTDPAAPQLVKIFEPIKMEDEKVGKADGRCVDVIVHGEYAYFTYDSFGVLCYSLEDLIEPLPAGVDPTKIWKVQTGVVLYDYRPEAVGEFRLREDPVYADLGGGALYMAHTAVNDEPVFYVAYGVAGVVKIVWLDPSNPVLGDIVSTVGECTAIALSNGRIFAADNLGGLVFFK